MDILPLAFRSKSLISHPINGHMQKSKIILKFSLKVMHTPFHGLIPKLSFFMVATSPRIHPKITPPLIFFKLLFYLLTLDISISKIFPVFSWEKFLLLLIIDDRKLTYQPIESKNTGPWLRNQTACAYKREQVFVFGGRNEADLLVSQLFILDLCEIFFTINPPLITFLL